MLHNEEINELMEQLKDRTLIYANELGIKVGHDGFVSCLMPDHKDSNPSMCYWEEIKAFRCFGCERIVNIFMLAHLYEKKPISGRGFINDNVFYLAEKFNIPYHHLMKELTEEEYEKQSKYRVMNTFADYVTAQVNEEHLNSRNITKETANKLMIGSVRDFNAMKNYLLSSGCTSEELLEIGIDDFRITPDKLIIIIKDEYGRPCSFTTRDMAWTHGCDRPKYNNGKATSIFNKSRIFYGWSDIKKDFNSYEPLLIVEGYIDFITAYQKGYRNIIALGSASFTDDHIVIIEKDRKINTVAITLDQDQTGLKRTKSILDRLKNIKTSKKYKFAVYKENNCKDLDELINSFEERKPLSDFFDFKTMFEYEILRLTQSSEDIDEDSVFDMFTSIISKTERPKEREDQIRTLSKYLTRYSKKTVEEEIDFLINSEKINLAKETDKIIDIARNQIKNNPTDASIILERAVDEVKDLEKIRNFDSGDIFSRAKKNFMQYEEDKSDSDKYIIDFNIPFLDNLNIYPGHTLIMSGLPNRGKSSYYQMIVNNAIEKNDNTFVLYISTDDSAEKIYANIIASITGLDRSFCENPYFHPFFGLKTEGVASNPNIKAAALRMYDTYSVCKENIINMIENKRLVILDVKDMVDNWNKIEKIVKDLSIDDSLKDKFKIMFIDSANKISVDGISNDNEAASYISSNLKKLSERHKFLTIANFELNKAKANERLRSDKLSGSRRMFYDCNVLAYVYQPMKDLSGVGGSDLVWTYTDQKGQSFIMPILVSYMEKSKCGANHFCDRPLFYELNTFNNRINTIIPGSPKDYNYCAIWNEEFEKKYTSF